MGPEVVRARGGVQAYSASALKAACSERISPSEPSFSLSMSSSAALALVVVPSSIESAVVTAELPSAGGGGGGAALGATTTGALPETAVSIAPRTTSSAQSSTSVGSGS